MTSFKVKLADINIGINSLFESTKTFLKDYLIDDCEDVSFSVAVYESDIKEERAVSDSTSLKEAGKVINYSDEYLETLALYRKIVKELLEYDVILFHGSCVGINDKAYLFTAKSGTGKSTHTRLYREVFDNVIMINDDKPLIKVKDDEAIIYGTPWNGKHNLSVNTHMKLSAICFLNRDSYNHIEEIKKSEMFTICMKQIYLINDDRDKMQHLLNLISKLLENVNCFKLGCNMDKEAAVVSYNGMNKDE